MMTQEDARRVIQSHKFVENHFIYGVAKRQANRAMSEVDTNIKNHTFMNSYIERKYGNKSNNMSACGDGGNVVANGGPRSNPAGHTCGHQQLKQQHSRNGYALHQPHHYYQQGFGGERKYGVMINGGNPAEKRWHCPMCAMKKR